MVSLCLQPVVKWCFGTEPHKLASASRQDGYSIGQEGKCVQQAIRDTQQDGYHLGGAEVQIESRGWSLKYQTCLIFCWINGQVDKLQPILTDSVNIAPDPRKIQSYRQDGASGTPPLGCSLFIS